MATTRRKSRFLWSVSLTCTIIICITILCTYLSLLVGKQKFSSRSVKQDSLYPEKLTGKNCIPICNTKECVMQAKNILTHMDSNVDPCDNAGSFICGDFVKKFAPSESGNQLASTKEKMLIAVKDILDNIQAETDSPSGKMKTVYDSCMNYDSSELQGAVPFQTFLKNELGISNWPYLDSDFKFADPRISELLGHVSFSNVFPILDIFAPYGDGDENYTYSVYFSKYEVNETEFIPEGVVHALDYFDLSQENIEIILSDIEDVKKSFVDLYSSLEHTVCEDNCSYVLVNCSNLSDQEWTLLCETIKVYHDDLTKFNAKDKRDALVIKVEDEILMKSFFMLLDSLPDRSVANYFAIRFLWKLLEDINFYFRLTKLDFDYRQHPRNKAQPDLWKNCIKWISNNMKLALSKEFFRHYLKSNITDEVTGFYDNFKSNLSKLLEHQEWIPPERKSFILSQVGNLTLNLMTIKNVLENETFLEVRYKSFHPTRESFFNNALQYGKIKFTRRRQRNRGDFATSFMLEHTEFEVGARTDMEAAIIMDYGIFFPPFYMPNLRSDVNRLLVALILGHEIGHNIVFLLGDYHFLGAPIFNDTDHLPQFLEAKECIENQFSGFKFDNLKENLNGTKYYSENLADSFSASLIDKLLSEYDSAQQKQFLLPGLAFSTEQLLYISAFQLFCSKEDLVSEKRFKEEDRHAPLKFRIIGTSQNSRSYSSLFQCSDGSFMNPEKKCLLLTGS